MLTSAIFLLLTSAIAVFVTMVVLLAHTVSRGLKTAFTLVMAGLLLWQINIFIADRVFTNLLFWNHLVFVWPVVAIFGFFIFMVLLRRSLLEEAMHRRMKRDTLGITMLLFLVAVQTVAIASGKIFISVQFDPVAESYIFSRGPFYLIYIGGLVAMLMIVIGYMAANFALSPKRSQQRQAFRIILITVGIGILYGVATNVLLPIFTDSQQYIGLGLATVDIVAFGFAFSIARHQFLDIRSYAFRAVVYVLTLLTIAIVYALGAGIVSGYILDIPLTAPAIFVLALITLAVAVSFEPLKDSFNRLTGRLFFREYYDPQDELDKLGTLLVGTVNPVIIQEQSKALLQDALKPTFIEFLLVNGHSRGNEKLLSQLKRSGVVAASPYEFGMSGQTTLQKTLQKREVALVVKLRTKHDDIGFILLGFRQSGASYSSGDKRFLGVVADQLAIGLQNALRFEEIQEFNITLRQRIDDATRKLRHTNEKLRQLDQTKDDFISMASHQLRTPLTSVKGYVSMVLEGDAGKVTPLQRKLLNQSFVSAQRMVYLISDLLNVSRLRTGKFVIEAIPSNLAKVIRDEIEQLQETAKGRGLELTYNKPEKFPTLMLDETKIRQVIMNFMDNAIYYTPTGGKIEVNLVEKPDSVEFTVTDTGMGVPKHEQHHLFSKFFRAHNAKRARPDGTGLGLFMAKKVVVAQGGAIIFKSKEGHGSTFGFSFAKDKLQPLPLEP